MWYENEPEPVGACETIARPYTTSWDAMRGVVERMRADGWGWSVDEYTPGNADAFLHPPDDSAITLASAPTVTEAFCIAALIALGHMDAA
jgi:hypothetical protein